MTKKSQFWYQHEILDAVVCEERFSITLRHVDVKNRRSILIVGDSNSKDIKFGSGAGTVGEKYPGKRIKAANIQNIDPRECVGFANVVIACGTNDLRPSEIVGEPSEHISKLFASLKSKVEQIDLLTKTKLFIMPVPPTRDSTMNKHIIQFNSLVYRSNLRARYNVSIPGLYNFLDRFGLLAANLTRGGDPIHFGAVGVSKFVQVIKEVVYERERSERGIGQPWMKPGTGSHRSGSQKPP